MAARMVLDVSGWLVAAVVAGVVVVLFALAWWSSGRARPLGKPREMSQAEKDYLASNPVRHRSQGGSFGGGGGLG